MALPKTINAGNKTKIQIRLHYDNLTAVYRVDHANSSSHPTFEVIQSPNGLYPQKIGRHLSGFSGLYDALARFHDLIGRNPLRLIKPMHVLPGPQVEPPPQINVDGTKRGGRRGGG